MRAAKATHLWRKFAFLLNGRYVGCRGVIKGDVYISYPRKVRGEICVPWLREFMGAEIKILGECEVGIRVVELFTLD